MPPPVNHDKRRREIAELACKLIAEGGLHKVTIRNLAKLAGYSTTVVTHYFSDRNEILLWAYRTAAGRMWQRFEAATSESDPVACLAALMPISAEARVDWTTYFAFAVTSAGDARLAAEQAHWLHKTQSKVAEVSSQFLDVPADEMPELGRKVVTTIFGVSVQALYEPEVWPVEEQRRYLEDYLRLVRSDLSARHCQQKIAGGVLAR